MLISVRHTTRYRYGDKARYSVQSLRLTPSTFDGQRIVEWSIAAPGFAKASRFRDSYGNIGHLVVAPEASDEMAITAHGVVETADRVGIVRGLVEVSPVRVYLRQTPMTKPDERIIALAEGVARGAGPVEMLHALMQAVHKAVAYEVGATEAHTTAAESLRDGKGVCQDLAHVFIAAARHLGVPARYVNGYVVAAGDEESTRSPAAHAWAEAHAEGVGWIGFDPVHRLCPTDRYVRMASGLDAAAAAPIRGSRVGGHKEALDVVVEVQQQGTQQQTQTQSQSQSQ